MSELATVEEHTDETAPPQEIKPKVGRALLVGMLLVIAVAVIGSFTGTRGDLRTLEKKGVPLDYAADKRLMPHDGDNAAPIYLANEEAIFETFRSTGQFRFGLPEFPPSRFSSPPRDEVMQSVKAAEPLIEKYRIAAAMPRCVFEPQPTAT